MAKRNKTKTECCLTSQQSHTMMPGGCAEGLGGPVGGGVAGDICKRSIGRFSQPCRKLPSSIAFQCIFRKVWIPLFGRLLLAVKYFI